MFGLGPMELVVVGMIGVLLFGNRIPGVARSIGQSIKEFKRGASEIETDVQQSAIADDRTEPAAQGVV